LYLYDRAAIRLDQLLSEWQQLRREHDARLNITARVHTGAVRLKFGWAST
jgi:hypothetical protein